MGRITVEIELANYEDMLKARVGDMKAAKVRTTRVSAIIDTGATRLVLPGTVAAQLGLPSAGKIKVRYANNRKETRERVKDVWLRLQGREGMFDAVVEPKRKDALVGAIVLEYLDLVVDCVTQTLHPRDPNWIISECE